MANEIQEIYTFVVKLFQKELKAPADKIEKTRKRTAGTAKILRGIVVTMIAVFVIAAIPAGYAFYKGVLGDDILALGGGALFVTGAAGTLLEAIRFIIINRFSVKVKSEIYAKIYQSLDPQLTYYPGKFKLPMSMYEWEGVFCRDNSNSFLFEKYIRELKFLPSYDFIRIDDVITGSYHGHEVKIIEFSLIEKREHVDSKGRRHIEYVEIFHGALFKTSMEKFVKAVTYVKQKNFAGGSYTIHGNGDIQMLEKVNLESNEFSKIYDVYSSDQIESRYFLNTATMEKFIKLKQSGMDVSCHVTGDRLNFLVHSDKDMFEPDINKPVNDPNSYFEVVFQAKLILDIITQLNLDSKTGL